MDRRRALTSNCCGGSGPSWRTLVLQQSTRSDLALLSFCFKPGRYCTPLQCSVYCSMCYNSIYNSVCSRYAVLLRVSEPSLDYIHVQHAMYLTACTAVGAAHVYNALLLGGRYSIVKFNSTPGSERDRCKLQIATAATDAETQRMRRGVQLPASRKPKDNKITHVCRRRPPSHQDEERRTRWKMKWTVRRRTMTPQELPPVLLLGPSATLLIDARRGGRDKNTKNVTPWRPVDREPTAPAALIGPR